MADRTIHCKGAPAKTLCGLTPSPTILAVDPRYVLHTTCLRCLATLPAFARRPIGA